MQALPVVSILDNAPEVTSSVNDIELVELADLLSVWHSPLDDLKLDDLTEELQYRNYCANRQYSPQIAPERWTLIYGPIATQFEERLQRVLDIILNKALDYCPNCDAKSVKCPGCNRDTSRCADCLWEQPNGMKVCELCAGKPEFGEAVAA